MDNQPKIAFITGISSGIGNALAHALLKAGFTVYGLGRSNTINESNYHFIPLDLRKVEAVARFNFPQIQAQSYLLINNAGMIGEILPVGELSSDHFFDVMQVNAVAPQVLINTFIQTFSRQQVPLHVVNISSGAARRPIDAWASYCASKAALDLFAETVKAEMHARHKTLFAIHAIAPGVVDTPMQSRIRAASPEKFLESKRFQDLKSNQELITPEHVATKIIQVIANPAAYPNTVMSLSDI